MFYGEYQHSIDRKGRIILPSKFRETAKANSIEKFFLNRGFEKCLFMFSEDEWRILLPASLKDFAGIKNEVVLVGVSTRIEIWDKERWQEFCRNSQPAFEQIAERLIGS